MRDSKSEQEFLGQLINFLTDLKELFGASKGSDQLREAVDRIDVFIHELRAYLHDIQAFQADTRTTRDKVELFKTLTKAAKYILEILEIFFRSS